MKQFDITDCDEFVM